MDDAPKVMGVGEQKLRDRRRKFWRMIGRGLLLGFVAGIAVGFVGGFTKGWQDAGGAWIGWAVWPVIAVLLFLFVRYCRDYFARIDELDLLDNLWSSLFGLYAVIMVYPIWSLLQKIGQAPAPSAQGIWLTGIIASVVAYGWRKLRHRF